MKLLQATLFSLCLVVIAGCAAKGTTDIYAAADEPHVLLSYPSPSEIGGGFYPAVLLRVDGRSVASAQRLTFRLQPGQHEFELQPSSSMIINNLPKGRQAGKVPGWFERRTVTMTLEAGEEYIFGARIAGENYAGWQPVVRARD